MGRHFPDFRPSSLVRVKAVAPGVIVQIFQFHENGCRAGNRARMQALKRIGKPKNVADVVPSSPRLRRVDYSASIPVDGGRDYEKRSVQARDDTYTETLTPVAGWPLQP